MEKILCMERATKLCFYTTVGDIRRTFMELNEDVSKNDKKIVRLNDWFKLLEIPINKSGDLIGWIYPDYLINARVTPTGIKVDGKEIHEIELIPKPTFL